ncbi:hypothetical protein L6164_005741 [Bauhinia variegata]|uniref:Uncharacterized protein n=1 Tax=Bauhinia variegata TaxID=167791 RepID=A0ACB9PTP4_BAUVA|nr:hypothetical protein L6164_005741 [Bauhinia variegata]
MQNLSPYLKSKTTNSSSPAASDSQIAGSSEDPSIDFPSPLFLHSSDSLGVVLVSKQFDSTSFNAWKRGMIIALSAKNKLGFITGELPKPDPSSPLLQAWNICNFIVISWILNVLNKEIAESVIYLSIIKSCFQFLMGLNDSFSATQGHILMMSPLPSVNQAYAILVHEEKQKEISIPIT